MTTPDTPARPVSYFTTAMLIEQRISHAHTTAIGKRVGVELRYVRDDPFAVALLLDFALIGPGERSEWRFARSMLAVARTQAVGGPAGDVAIVPHPCRRYVEFALADRVAGRTYRLSLEMTDVEAALLVFEQVVALAAEPHIAPNLDTIAAELRAILEAETAGGDR